MHFWHCTFNMYKYFFFFSLARSDLRLRDLSNTLKPWSQGLSEVIDIAKRMLALMPHPAKAADITNVYRHAIVKSLSLALILFVLLVPIFFSTVNNPNKIMSRLWYLATYNNVRCIDSYIKNVIRQQTVLKN